MDNRNNELPANPPPPSEWYVSIFSLQNYSLYLFYLIILPKTKFVYCRLEDTLIELYLSGYSNHAIDAPCGTTTASDERMLEEINGVEKFECSVEGVFKYFFSPIWKEYVFISPVRSIFIRCKDR